jgi:PDZ domain-containing protein
MESQVESIKSLGPRAIKAIRRRLGTIIVLAILLGVIAYKVPSGYYAFFPGDAMPVSPMVSVEGGAKDAQGRFYMTTISAREANFLIYLYARIDPRVDLKTREEYLPKGMDTVEYSKYLQRLMDESRAAAAVVGLRAMGIDAKLTGEGVRIVEVMLDGPANGKLLRGDIISAVDGIKTNVTEDLTSYMGRVKVQDTVTFTVRRDGKDLIIPLTTVDHPTQKGRAAVRITIETEKPGVSLPLKVEIDPGNVTGPSAGLMFALEVINQVDTRHDLTHGKRIAGTGTISASGTVGPVGGTPQKVAAAERAGAEYFLVPASNLSEAQRTARRIKLVPVANIRDALSFLEKLGN